MVLKWEGNLSTSICHKPPKSPTLQFKSMNVCWRRLLRVPWTAGRSNKSILKEINPEYSLEGLMLKLQYFGHRMGRANLLEKTLILGKDWRQEAKGMTEDEMVAWHHQLNGHEFEQALGDGQGQGSLVCCSPWDRKESDVTEWVNNNPRARHHGGLWPRCSEWWQQQTLWSPALTEEVQGQQEGAG